MTEPGGVRAHNPNEACRPRYDERLTRMPGNDKDKQTCAFPVLQTAPRSLTLQVRISDRD